MIGKLKMVTWVDSAGTPKWGRKDTVCQEPATCVTVGYVIHDTKEALTVAQTVRVDENGPGDVHHSMTIPRGCIKSIRNLK